VFWSGGARDAGRPARLATRAGVTWVLRGGTDAVGLAEGSSPCEDVASVGHEPAAAVPRRTHQHRPAGAGAPARRGRAESVLTWHHSEDARGAGMTNSVGPCASSAARVSHQNTDQATPSADRPLA
jgi:hypothetical protein